MLEEQSKVYRVYQWRDGAERQGAQFSVMYGVQKRVAKTVWVDLAKNSRPLIFANAAEAHAACERLCANT
jgi:hypothetical protein